MLWKSNKDDIYWGTLTKIGNQSSERQRKKGKNSKTNDHFDEIGKRLKMLENVCEQRNLSDFNLRGDLLF